MDINKQEIKVHVHKLYKLINNLKFQMVFES